MKLKRLSAAVFIAALIALLGFVRPADDPIVKIAAQLSKWLADNPQEKVYLQIDKPYYAAGDDIWFKAYVVTASEHKLSAISGVLNVELIDDRDSIKQSLKLPVVNGLTWGDFALPDTLSPGNYRIRAYTNWMRNAGADYFFDKTIAIVSAAASNVFIQSVYDYRDVNGKQQVEARIRYTDADGKPYKASRVNYSVRLNGKSIARGSGITDDNGNLNISFANPGTGLAGAGRIITTLHLNDKSTVTKQLPIKAANNKVDVQFFPEGGNLVYGNNSRIAFKAVGADGLGVPVKGVVTDDQDKTITDFTTLHAGMGVFDFIPQSGRIYRAKLTYADGSQSSVALPSPSTGGYMLRITEFDGNIVVKILPGPDVIRSAAETGRISLVAQSGGVIYYAGKSAPGSKSFSAIIPKTKFPSGIVQFTLFSPSAEPMNERLVFVRNPDQLKLNIVADRLAYAPRGLVKLEMNATNANNKPVIGSFSVAVTDEAKVGADNAEQTILSNLLLTSDLRGYIENPTYYFSGEELQASAALDVLMLTQGFRRFEWKALMAGTTPPPVYQPEKTVTVSGHIKTLGGKPVPFGKVTLLTTTGGTFVVDTTADDKGRFAFTNLVFEDSVKFVVQARTAKDRKNVQIDLDNIAPPAIARGKSFPDLQAYNGNDLSIFLQNSRFKNEQLLKYGLTGKPEKMLKEVRVTAKKNPAEHSANLNGPGNADQVIGAEEFEKMGCFRISDCLQGRLAGVVFRNGTPYLMRNLRYPMQLIIDGMTIDDPSILDNFNPSDVESVEVLKSIGYTSIYGMRGGGGVLLITTKRGGPVSYRHYAPGIIVYNPKGYYKSRVFYSPQYDNPKTNAAVPDLRSTIYWNPNVITNNDGKTSFSFFNADGKGTYRVVIEGIDSDGNLGRQVYRYKVE